MEVISVTECYTRSLIADTLAVPAQLKHAHTETQDTLNLIMSRNKEQK